MNYSLLDKTIQTYIWLGIVLYVILLLFWKDSFTYYNVLNIFTFATYAFLLWTSANKPDEYYTNKRLGWTVFLYSLFFVGMYLMMYVYYDKDTFFFDYTDPYAYAKLDDILIKNKVPFFDMAECIEKKYSWGYDDWGAPIAQTIFLKIIPSKFFLFFSQIVLGTIGALAIFFICRSIMLKEYAYLASLSFSIASYSIYYYGSYRKESIMVFIVIICFWCFYKYLESERSLFLGLALLVSGVLFFFRPPVVVFFGVAMVSYFITKKGENSKLLIILVVFLIVFGLAYSIILDNADRYTSGGDVTKGENYEHTTIFGIVVSAIGTLVGPFPQLLQLPVMKMSQIPIYGSGLLLRFLLFFAFWKGLIYCIRNRKEMAIPLYTFVLLEMLGLALVNDGLELRKSMPHIPIVIMAAFWYMSQYDEDADYDIQQTPYYVWSIRSFSVCAIAVFVLTIFWNTLRIIQ